MAVTENAEVADRIRLLSLHGLSADAWGRFTARASWDYRIVAPGYKYNLTDIAAAIGLHQLARAEEMRRQREELAGAYLEALAGIDEIELPVVLDDRIHSWHLFLIRLHLDRLTVDRRTFTDELRDRGIGHSVHWRPLHLHPYYQETFSWQAEHLPVASREWQRIITLPLFPSMTRDELDLVVATLEELCRKYRRHG